jgi:hypothetical protein
MEELSSKVHHAMEGLYYRNTPAIIQTQPSVET